MDKSDKPYRARLRTFAIVKVAESSPITQTPITMPSAVASYLLPFFREKDSGSEHFGVLYLNAKHHPIAGKILFSGTINEAKVYIREVARTALLLNAAAIIIAHNHNSGNIYPSTEDLVLTKRVREALSILEIRLIDSLVFDVESGRHRSLRECGDLSFDAQ